MYGITGIPLSEAGWLIQSDHVIAFVVVCVRVRPTAEQLVLYDAR